MTWRGDTWFYSEESFPSLDALELEGGYGIPIFKPRAQDILKRLIERAEKAGCPAVGVDLDGCGSTIMAKHGQQVYRKTVGDLRELVRATSLPSSPRGSWRRKMPRPAPRPGCGWWRFPTTAAGSSTPRRGGRGVAGNR